MAGKRRAKSGLILTGIKEVDDRLKEMKTAAANRAARAGLNAGGRVLLKGIKTDIPSRYKDAKRAMGMKTKMEKGGPNKGHTVTKVGAAVGKKKPNANMTKRKRRGVGIGLRNIHWFLLGTKERFIKGGPRAGQSTGQMLKNGQAPLEGLVPRKFAELRTTVMQVIKEKTLEQIYREWQKAARKTFKA